jgi:hypothetical protein
MEPDLIMEHFGNLSDPWEDNKCHKLIDILVITICAVICGADKWKGPQSICMVKSQRIIGEEKTCKRCIAGKRLLPGWDNAYIEKVLFAL